MKKYYILGSLILIIGIVITILLVLNNKSEMLYFEEKTEKNNKVYQIDEKNAVYTNYSKLYYINKNGDKTELGMALKNKFITIDEIIDKINYKDMAMDGGSIVAKNDSSKNKLANIDFTIIKCKKNVLEPVTNEIYTIQDVYIGDFELENVCN